MRFGPPDPPSDFKRRLEDTHAIHSAEINVVLALPVAVRLQCKVACFSRVDQRKRRITGWGNKKNNRGEQFFLLSRGLASSERGHWWWAGLWRFLYSLRILR